MFGFRQVRNTLPKNQTRKRDDLIKSGRNLSFTKPLSPAGPPVRVNAGGVHLGKDRCDRLA